MPIIEHKKGEAMSPHLNRLIKDRIKGQPLSFYMGTLFWPKDGWHDSETGEVISMLGTEKSNASESDKR